MHIYVNSILLIHRDRTIINRYIPRYRGHIKYWKSMDEKARNLLDRNLHIRVTNQFEQQLSELARQNNLKPSTFTRLVLMKHIFEYNPRNRFF